MTERSAQELATKVASDLSADKFDYEALVELARRATERDALMAEHEAARKYHFDQSPDNYDDWEAAHDAVEAMLHE